MLTCTETLDKFVSNQDSYLDESNFQQVARIVNENSKNAHVYEFLHRNRAQESKQQRVDGNRCFFSSRNPANLNSVQAIKIVILRTLNSSSPCLKSIKVFGKLARGGDLPDMIAQNQSNNETNSDFLGFLGQYDNFWNCDIKNLY